MTERWLPVPGWEGSYEVSDHGRVRSVDRVTINGSRWKGRVLKPAPHRSGHQRVVLISGKVRKNRFVHELVLLAFVGPRPIPEMDSCHGDGNPMNNRLGNLRWDTKRNNQLDAVKHGKNELALRTHCPRGHELAEWNNVTWYAVRGRRTCKSCGNARSYARTHNTVFDPAKADDYYAFHKLQKDLAA